MRGGRRGARALGIVGKYCVQDTVLVAKLFDKLQTWVGLTEMAKVCNVPPFYLYTQGQQIKVFSQIYKKCTHENIVVEKDGYIPKDNEHYVGAKVFDPVVGVHDRVVPFDFSSLYPTTIIAYNIDYSTLVIDPDIPDELCHVMEWEDHVGCEHDPKVARKMKLTKYIAEEKKELTAMRADRRGKKGDVLKEHNEEIERRVKELKPYQEERTELNKTKPKYIMCTPRYYRFLKEPLGVLPSLLKDLLDARSHTKKDMKKAKNRLHDEKMDDATRAAVDTLFTVLNKRQLAYKVSANSGYGAMGVQRGYLPFMPGAMATTAMGRKSIEIVADVIPKKYKGELVYGDTDSNYIAFPHLANATAAEIWEYSEWVAAEVTKLFPPPMNLAFEEIIYWRFLILSKKRYMSLACEKDGIVDQKIKKKGVLLARRDNCNFIRKVYAEIIMKIFHKESRDDILYYFLQEVNKLCSHSYGHREFVVTQAVGSSGGLELIPFVNEKGKEKGKIGDYTVDILPTDPVARESKMALKKATTEEEYYLRCLPAQVQCAEKMGRRGKAVEPGSRLEFVVTTEGGPKAKKYEKIESAEYFAAHSETLTLDYFYYMKQLVNPIDQVLNALYVNPKTKPKYKFTRNFVLEQYKYRTKVRAAVINELKELTQPKLVFE
jgi:DNA polymerase elongation subunit (family B)